MRAITQDQMKFVKVNGEQMFNEKKKKKNIAKKKKKFTLQILVF